MAQQNSFSIADGEVAACSIARKQKTLRSMEAQIEGLRVEIADIQQDKEVFAPLERRVLEIVQAVTCGSHTDRWTIVAGSCVADPTGEALCVLVDTKSGRPLEFYLPFRCLSMATRDIVHLIALSDGQYGFMRDVYLENSKAEPASTVDEMSQYFTKRGIKFWVEEDDKETRLVREFGNFLPMHFVYTWPKD